MTNSKLLPELTEFVERQLSAFYGITDSDRQYIREHLSEAVDRTLRNFSHMKNKYYSDKTINVLHTGQYMTFLYYLANTIFRNEIENTEESSNYYTEKRTICDKLFCLNKLVSSCDLYYEVMLQEYFWGCHPVGSVIGLGKYGKGFLFDQGCTVGSNGNIYPVIGENVFMYSDSKVLGNSHIGNNVLIGANTYIKDMDIPDETIVYGQYPNVIIKTGCSEQIHQIISNTFVAG